MAKSVPLYRLVVFEEVDDPQGNPRPVLQGGRASTRPTPCSGWRGCRGSGPRPLSETETRSLLDGLYEYGVPAEAWRNRPVPRDLPAADDPHGRLPARRAFRVQGLRGEPTHWVPWDRIDWSAAGRSRPRTSSGASAARPGPGPVGGPAAITLRGPKPPRRTQRPARAARPGGRGDHRPPRPAPGACGWSRTR